jgi:hypothetical protein
MSVLLNADAELRSGWKFAIYVVLFLLLWVATGLAITLIVAGRNSDLLTNSLFLLGINDVALFVPAVAAMWLSARFIDHRPLRTFGVGFLPHWRRDLLFGLALAAAMLAILIGGCYALGYVNMRWTATQVSPGILIATFVLLLVAAANEELVFRGFPLQMLIDGLGKWPAIIGMSTLFAAMHWRNPNATLLSTVNTLVAGILLSLAYVRTRSLWLPYGIHVGWNLGLGFIFGFSVSGWDFASLWITGTAGSEIILGGGYGPEGGLLATFLFASAALIVEKYGSINSTEARVGGHTGRHHRNRAGDS